MHFGLIFKTQQEELIFGRKKSLLIRKDFVLNRRLVNAEHNCVAHRISIFLSIQTFYLSVYDVRQTR